MGVAAPVGAAGSAPPATRSLRPNITPWLIPFGPKRKREMAAYSERHYGQTSGGCAIRKVIVEHIAETGSAAAVYDTFAPDVPDVELHELPNVCSHFVVSSSGRIYELVNLASAAATRSGSTGPRSGSSTPASAIPTCSTTRARCTPRCG